MAPEQLQGKPADNRGDLFAFGCVLYEMLTGKRAFDGSSNASVIAAILERPAPSVKEVAPAALDRVLRLCLEKDPDERWQTAHDLKAELVWIAGGGTEVPRQAEEYSVLKKWKWGAASLLIATIAALAVWKLRPAPASPVTRTVIALGADEQLANLNGTVIAISPDGSNVVYVASRGGGPAQLFLRPLDALKAEPMAGTEGAASPFFSPDGQWIGFIAGSKLEKVAIGGGAAVMLCDVGDGSSSAFPGATWSPHNTIVFQGSGPFREVPAGGGTPQRVAENGKSAYRRWLDFTPDGSAIVFASGTDASLLCEQIVDSSCRVRRRGHDEGTDTGGNCASSHGNGRSGIRAERDVDGRSFQLKTFGAGGLAVACVGGHSGIPFRGGAVQPLGQRNTRVRPGSNAGFHGPPGLGRPAGHGAAACGGCAWLLLSKALPGRAAHRCCDR